MLEGIFPEIPPPMSWPWEMLWQKEPLAKNLFEFSISHRLLWRCICHAIARVELIEFRCWARVSHKNKQTQTLVAKVEKAMAPHSSTLAWKIPWTEEPGRLQSMGSLRVGHGWATSLSLFTFVHWRRKWHRTSVLLPGESHEQRSLIGCCLWGHTESDTTEVI